MPSFGQQFPYYPSLSQNIQPSAMQPMFSSTTTSIPQPVQGLIKVTGTEGAKAYQMPPNSVMPLFDANNDIMYIKSTDGAGFPTIREFSFSPIEPKQPASQSVDYVPRSEFDKLAAQVKELLDAKQPVSSAEQPTA